MNREGRKRANLPCIRIALARRQRPARSEVFEQRLPRNGAYDSVVLLYPKV
jgi:hypothetical protein